MAPIAKGGQILDATMIPVPKQRNSKEENQQIKQGQVPSEWNEKPHKLSQKDRAVLKLMRYISQVFKISANPFPFYLSPFTFPLSAATRITVVHRIENRYTDARWTKKRGTSYYGYKDHINVSV